MKPSPAPVRSISLFADLLDGSLAAALDAPEQALALPQAQARTLAMKLAPFVKAVDFAAAAQAPSTDGGAEPMGPWLDVDGIAKYLGFPPGEEGRDMVYRRREKLGLSDALGPGTLRACPEDLDTYMQRGRKRR